MTISGQISGQNSGHHHLITICPVRSDLVPFSSDLAAHFTIHYCSQPTISQIPTKFRRVTLQRHHHCTRHRPIYKTPQTTQPTNASRAPTRRRSSAHAPPYLSPRASFFPRVTARDIPSGHRFFCSVIGISFRLISFG